MLRKALFKANTVELFADSRKLAAMKQQIKRIISKLPGGWRLLQEFYDWKHRETSDHAGAAKVFTEIHDAKSWGSEESVSGPGSTVEYTRNIREQIPRVVEKYGVRQILDAPCGDYNWFRLIERPGNVAYLGGDIVETLVRANQEKYGNANTQFLCLDIVNDELPKADLWLCRDCWLHLPNKAVFKAISNFLNSEIPYLLTSSHTHCESNTDIPAGSARQLNLELPPFSFCKPILAIEDWIEGFPVRHLCLWGRQQLSRALASNKELRRLGKTRR